MALGSQNIMFLRYLASKDGRIVRGFFNLKRVENVTRQNMRGNHVDFSDPFIESSRIETIDPRVSSKEGETTSARDKAPNGELPVRTNLPIRGSVVGS